MQDRLQKFQGLSAEEESKLLSLNDEQKKLVVENDRKLKNEFLAKAPEVSHGTIKMSEKYRNYVSMVQAANH